MLQNGRRESHQDGSVRTEMNQLIWPDGRLRLMRIAESENCDTSRVPELLGHTVDFTYQKWVYPLAQRVYLFVRYWSRRRDVLQRTGLERERERA